MEKFELSTAVKAATAAGGVILQHSGNRSAEKIGLEFKTMVDKFANETIIKIIHAAFPQDSIITEEDGSIQSSKERVWVIDPLDGTTNWLNSAREYSVLIGLFDKQQLVLGVCLLPATKELYTAVKDEGTYRNGEKIHVSDIDNLKLSRVGIDTGYDPDGVQKLTGIYPKLKPHVGNIPMYNANGYSLAMLAKGELTGMYYTGYCKIWEAAGFLLVTEAGGKVTDLDGNDLKLDLNSREGFSYLASNGLIHEDLITAVR